MITNVGTASGPTEEEITVTPEMVRAGTAALDAHRESFIDELLVQYIYIAMREQEDRQTSP